MKRILPVLMALVLMCSVCIGLPARAVLFTPGFDVHSAAGILVDLDTDEVLWQKNADTQYMPGSLVQIMAAVVVIENCPNLSTRITVDASLYESLAGTEYPEDIRYADIMDGDTFSVEELLYAMILTSSCEAATMLANQFGNGSVASFVEMMNTRATELGCTQTRFTNVTGLYDVEQKTTAQDMALITKHALSISKFQTIATAVTFTPETPNLGRHELDFTWTHSNLMLQPTSTYYMEGCKGIKTANLAMQGRNIVTQASRDGMNFLVILLAAPFNDEDDDLQFYHMDDAKALFDWVFGHFSFKTILSENTELGQVGVTNGDGTDYVLVRPERSYGTLWYDLADSASIVQEVELKDSVSAPVEKGQKLGTVTLKFSGEDIATIDLVSTSTVELSSFKYYLALIRHFPKTPWLSRAIVISVILVLLYIVACIYSHIQYLQRKKNARPVHLQPNSEAIRRDARREQRDERRRPNGTRRPPNKR